MIAKAAVEAVVTSMKERIAALDDETMAEVVGVAQALAEMQKAMAKVDACLHSRQYEKAASLGYTEVSSAFVFLQRTLGGLHHLSNDKAKIVTEIAAKLRRAYEEVLPCVDAIMQSTQAAKCGL